VMRANLDGSNIETLVRHEARAIPAPGGCDEVVRRIAVDVEGGKFYWTQKGPDKRQPGAPSSGPTSRFRPDRRRRTAGTSSFVSTRRCPSDRPDIDRRLVRCTGRIGETHRAVTR